MAEKSHLWDRSGKLNDPGTDCGHASRQISPPPLRRQRTGPETSHSFSNRSRPTAGPSHLSLSKEEVSCRRSSITTLKPTAKTTLFGDTVRPKHPFPTSYSANLQAVGDQDQNQNRSLRKSVTRSGSRAISVSKTKPKCRACSKTTNVTYNPIISCFLCQTHYHDSCRRPALSEGVAARDWKCFECLSDGSRRTSKPPTSSSFTSDAFPISSGLHNIGHTPPAPEPSVYVQPRVAESHDGRITIEESVPDLSPARCEQKLLRTHPDNHHHRNGGVHKHMHQEKVVIFDATASASALSHIALLDGSTDNANPYQTLTDTRKVISKSFPRAKMDVETPERTEVPNTPTQRSSQLNISSPAPHLRGGASWASPQRDDSMLIEPVPRAKIASKTVLCSVCQHQRLLAKEGSTKPTCQRCQDRTRIVESGKSEIQESPGGTPVTTKPARGGSTPSATNIKAPALHAAASEAPMPWFESGLVAPAIKIKQKKIRVSQPSIGSQTVGIRPKDPATVGPNVSATQIIPDRQLVEEGQREGDQPDGSQDRNASISNDRAKFVSSHHQESASGHVQGSCPGSAAISEQITVLPATPSSNHIEPVRQVRSGDIHAMHSASMDRRRSDAHAQYTMRQLARIALVSSNGSCMTTSQILLWIARTFPSLKVGEGRWERSVQACLSKFDEFDGRKIHGAQGSKKLYGFSSVAFKTRFEQDYPEFCAAPESRPKSLEAEQKIVVDDSKRKTNRMPIGWARKSAPSLPHPLSTMQADPIIGPEAHRSSAAEMKWCPTPEPILPFVREQSGTSMAAKGYNPNVRIRRAEEGMPFMPFQRNTPHRQVGTLGSVMSTTKETSFHNVYALGLPSIDTMAHTEKAEKVSQIKARPSRKKYFGSDYRLAHKRRHALADIHDESNGAWNPIRSAMTGQQAPSDQDEDMDPDEEGTRSLREVFDLPDNMIPMNDGHTELAFRDGTLINGRLPRPRNVFKVGKMFGGELTIRTS